MMRLFWQWMLIALPLAMLTAATTPAALLAAETEPDYAAELPRIPPKEPAEAIKTFQVVPGFHLEQAATEPLVCDPVAMAFDERGRLFVVEMRDYSEQDKDFLGTIRLLEDTDGDGRFDKSTIYSEELSWPTAAICYDGGLFVGAAPDIYYLKDTDGDGKADQRKLVFTGFGRTNVQGLINTFQWGLDNRIHGATSSSGAEVTSPERPNDKPIVLRGRDFAFDPRTFEMQPTSGGAQHGMTFDNWGRKFVCSNSDHIQMVMFEDRYLARNPYLPAPSPRVSIAVDGPQAEVFRISPVEPWRVVRTRLRVSGEVKGAVEGGGRAAGYFTGATGTTIYRGNAFPDEFVGQAFVGDVGSNIVHRKVLKPNSVGFTAHRVDERREFVASTDTWFRPAQYANAPDGTLYIADVYREVIEHPASIPPSIKKHLDLTSGRDRGRIYRLVPDGFKQPKLPRLDQATTAELVATLEHENGWHRDTAARLLFERQDKSAVEALNKLVAGSKLPEARMQAMYALDGLDALTENTVAQALEDKHPRVREHAIRLSEQVANQSGTVREKLFALAGDDDVRVRYQLAFTLGELDDSRRFDALAAIAKRDGEDRWVKLAVLSSLPEGASEVFARLVADAEARKSGGGQSVLASLAAQVGAQKNPAAVAAMVKALEQLPAADVSLQRKLILGLNQGLAQSGSSLRATLAAAGDDNAAKLVNDLIAAAKQQASDEKQPMATRVAAVGTLALGSLEDVGSTLASLLENRQPQDVQLAALEVLGKHNAPQVANAILAAWPGMSPRVRSQASDDLLARPQRVVALLDAIEKGSVSATELDPARIKLLETHRDKKIAARAAKLLASQKLGARNDVVESYRKALSMSGDQERGQAVFKKICSACHKLDGVGHEIGPNLATMQSRGAEAILVNVLDPNREVNPQYVNYILQTDDGLTLTGMIAAETATSVTLKREEGKTDTVLRLHIDQLQSTRQSIMPEGMEKQIDPQAMADLLAYLTAKLPQGNAGTWKAGAAKLAITPQQNMWMSGYGGRDKPSEGKLTDLWAKALVIEDPRGERAVMVTLDLVGIDRDLMLAVQKTLKQKHKLEPRQIALCTSHTHCGPVVGSNLESMYFFDAEQKKLVTEYTAKLQQDIVAVVDAAMNKLAPAELAWGNGRTDFAVNRRNNKEPEVPAIRAAGKQLNGPVDHDVPVLKVTGADGKVKAVAFGYACHATVLGFYQWCADYPGFAQIELEKKHPGAVALFWAGCGADQNPLPRRTVELAQKYGGQLAAAVDQVLAGEMKPVQGELNTVYQEIDMPLDKLPSRADLLRDTESSNRYTARRAKLLLEAIEKKGALSPTYPYPVQTWRLGSELQWVTLGGEVVVDYSLRIKKELGAENTWVAGYTNDVMAYIPSLRVLKEGGYEGATSMVYYGMPTVWAPEVEETLMKEVHRQAEQVKASASTGR